MIHKNLCWWGDNGNWGDQLNPKLFSFISGVPTDEINRIGLEDENLTPRLLYRINSQSWFFF